MTDYLESTSVELQEQRAYLYGFSGRKKVYTKMQIK